MKFTATGLSHKTAPLKLRERLAVSQSETPAVLESLRREAGLDEVALMSTCNRVEIYACGRDREPEAEKIAGAFASIQGLCANDFTPYIYSHSGRDAVKHLCNVACGIDSMVLGETEVLGQVRQAYLSAASSGTAGKFIGNLFQAVFRTAKHVHTDTALSKGKISVGSVAVDLAEELFEDISDVTVLVIGAGDMGKVTLSHLADRGVGAVIIANRTYERAVELAGKFGGSVVHFDAIAEWLERADIIISSSAAPHLILKYEQVYEAACRRSRHPGETPFRSQVQDAPPSSGRPMFIIDISVPRNVDSQVAEIENVHLYNIDDLQQVVDKNTQARRGELEKCNRIIDEHIERFVAQWAGQHTRINEHETGKTAL